MLSFIEKLKNVLCEVEQTGGNELEMFIPEPSLVQKLKAFALKDIEHLQTSKNDMLSLFLLEDFNEGFFDEGVRVSIIFLKSSGITDYRRIEKILKKVIKKRSRKWLGSENDRHLMEVESDNLENALVNSVAEAWEEGGTELSNAYTFAKQRALITWNYRENNWNITSLGRFFMELNAFYATCFLLTIDICLSTGMHDYPHISREELKSILDAKSDRYFNFSPIHRSTLRWMGILSIESEMEEHQNSLTPLGRKALEYVLSESNLMTDTVILSLQADEQGFIYVGLKSEIKKFEDMLDSPLIDDADRQSIQNALVLCERGQYIDGLRIIFPCVEGVINKMLQEIGENPDEYSGWKKKIDYLVSKGVIPPDVSKAVEIIIGRNKTLHGQFAPPDPEYAYPLFQMAVIYLRRMLSAWIKYEEHKSI